MLSIKDIEVGRSRGIVWVCDLAGSSKYFNDDNSVDHLEKFLQRFLFISSKAVESAGGQYIKWTGDGFLAWFETPLHRSLPAQVTRVFEAAWHLTFLINVTQLGLQSKPKFKIRHGITFENDALLLNIKYSSGEKSLDLLGRTVVLAFRLSDITADFPGVTTQRELVKANRQFGHFKLNFTKKVLSVPEKLQFLKGERWGAQSIYVSRNQRPRLKTRRALLKSASHAIAAAEGRKPSTTSDLEFHKNLVSAMSTGPSWCHEILIEEKRFLREELLAALKQSYEILKRAAPVSTASRVPKSSQKATS